MEKKFKYYFEEMKKFSEQNNIKTFEEYLISIDEIGFNTAHGASTREKPGPLSHGSQEEAKNVADSKLDKIIQILNNFKTPEEIKKWVNTENQKNSYWKFSYKDDDTIDIDASNKQFKLIKKNNVWQRAGISNLKT